MKDAHRRDAQMSAGTERVPARSCPGCGARLDARTEVVDASKPAPTPTEQPGDVSVCFYCGEVLRFTAMLELEPISPEDLHGPAYVSVAPTLLRLQREIRAGKGHRA